jgi:hypothetical protein
MIWKVTHQTAGGHVHCSLFNAVREGATFRKCGDFCVGVEDFPDMKRVMSTVVFEERKP